MNDVPKEQSIIVTERFDSRLFDESDVDDLYALYADADVMRFLHGPRTRETAEKDIAKFAEQYEKTGYTLWAVVERTTGGVVGRVGLWPLDQTDEVELGYIVGRPYQNQGIATETSAACLRYAFEELKLPFVAAITVPENRASLRVMQKLGFRFVREDRFYDTDVLYHRRDNGAAVE